MNNKDKKEKSSRPEQYSFSRELGEFMKPYKKGYNSSVLISIIAVLCGIFSYAAAGKLIGKVFSGNAKTSVVTALIVGIAVLKIANIILVNISTWISHHAAYNTLADIRKAVSSKLVNMPLGYFEVNGSGRLKTVIVDRIEGMENTLAHLYPEMTGNLTAPLFIFVWMFFIDWRMALIILGWVVFGMLFFSGMMIGYEEKYKGQIAASKSMNQAVVEYINGIEVIKTFNQTDSSYKKYSDAVMHNAEYSINWTKQTQIFTSIILSIAPFSVFPTVLAGIKFWSDNTLSTENLFLLIILSLGIYGPIQKAFSFFDTLAQMGTTAHEIREILDHNEIERNGSDNNEGDLELKAENISFRYSDKTDNVLTGISFTVPKGSMLALVGPSGGGKSTIAKLLAGYWEPASGVISIGGNSINNFSQEKFNSLVSSVDQDTFLFDMSIMENIRIGKKDATDEEVIAAAKRAGCDEFIRSLPEGYNTSVGEAGGKLSGGERQRIAIARAIMKDSPIMIFDEATASADPENEALIQNALSEAGRDKTLIVVAHKLSTITSAEQIAYIEKGTVKCIGTHEEMLRKCPEYLNLWNITSSNGGEV
ncbi:ABC transporter ATP-binding protein [Ruminococcus flavefaciens]|uniref:ATP-binding cassette, subfamily B n=1 Tax=Ruminococcus flavefaciens TaxID=1265 RepID=A0A1M7K568_RUMFL|nr:ABC transporter ATP-binding protein [Ruminococcus flavefaciens]SHM60331.1 ATP-binding cassette, subfamily B [Ruminococcus flavefaciens]